MTNMNRRKFMKTAGVGAVASAGVAAPAIAQSSPEISWRLTCSWPKSLDTLYGAPAEMAKYVAEATDNKFKIQVFAAGEIVPALQATDAVINGSVEMCHTAQYYMWGKDPTWALGCAVPFGLNGRQQTAWWNEGGEAMLNAFHAKHNVYSLLCGNTQAQMGGWFRKEINTVDDLKGLKFRIGGFAGAVMSKLGVVPQQIGGGDIYPSLEKGTIDGAEWVGPYDDEKLGFYKVAKYYYYPGWWEGGAMLHMVVNGPKWAELPKHYQAILTQAGEAAHNWMVAKYDAVNAGALRRLVAAGTELRAFPQPVMEACFKAATDHYADLAGKSPLFKKALDSHQAFRAEQYVYWQIAEHYYDTWLMAATRKG